jgi:DNA polymerase V
MVRGGQRIGSGRPSGSGKFKEPTKAIRVPVSMVEKIGEFINKRSCMLPLYGSKVAAGFPAPADEHIDDRIDLNEYLIHRPESTFLVRATGNSMIGAGIHPDDILVVDRSIEPKNGKIVIVAINGELTVKRLLKTKDKIQLLPENVDFEPISILDSDDLHIWGVVTNVVHKL